MFLKSEINCEIPEGGFKSYPHGCFHKVKHCLVGGFKGEVLSGGGFKVENLSGRFQKVKCSLGWSSNVELSLSGFKK